MFMCSVRVCAGEGVVGEGRARMLGEGSGGHKVGSMGVDCTIDKGKAKGEFHGGW